jgi:hypothetical protein
MTNDDITIFAAITIVPGAILMGILWVAFEEITVRKLRNNPKTKNKIGLEFVSGGNIVGVAQTLSLPRWIVRRSGNFLGILPDPDMLYRHTTKLDRFLGRAFYWTLITTVICTLTCIFLWWLTPG